MKRNFGTLIGGVIALLMVLGMSMFVVDQPCSIGTRTTLPPRASTVSRPMMASRAQSAPLTRTSG